MVNRINQTPVRATLQHTPTEWADLIRDEWRTSVGSIVKVGQYLESAKEDVQKHRNMVKDGKLPQQPTWLWEEWVVKELVFKPASVQKLMRITKNPVLCDERNHWNLPACWTTLARMATIEPKELQDLVSPRGTFALPTLGSDSTRADVDRVIQLQKAGVDLNPDPNRMRDTTEVLKSLVDAGSRYMTILLDPPWSWQEANGKQCGGGTFMGTAPKYKTMSMAEIRAKLPIGALSAKNAHIYLWVTNKCLPQGYDLLQEWGFDYVTTLTWCKPSIGPGKYFRGTTEHVLFGVKGSLPLLRNDEGTHFRTEEVMLGDYFDADRGSQHSEKPELFYEIVEGCSRAPRIELFARKQRPAFYTWGNEVGSDSLLASDSLILPVSAQAGGNIVVTEEFVIRKWAA